MCSIRMELTFTGLLLQPLVTREHQQCYITHRRIPGAAPDTSLSCVPLLLLLLSPGAV
jgi:hypothetical protein